MRHQVILKFGHGSWQQGFPAVTAQIGRDGEPHQIQVTASLPPAFDLPELYRHWQVLYLALYDRLGWRFRITFDDTQATITNFSSADFHTVCQQLRSRFNVWLNSPEFRPIYQKLWQTLSQDSSIRLLIETNDFQLRQFPWHLWDFFQDYPRAEFALSNPNHELIPVNSRHSSSEVRILAIFGNKQGLDLQQDQALLENLPSAKLTLLPEPSRQSISDQMWRHSWDIFFFAGHSSSQMAGQKGKMSLDGDRTLTIGDLENALRRAISQGLQLAIFNSCEGLGLVGELENLGLHIPQIIVMREAVPDRVAQAFLSYFLEALARGESFYLAVREARERLHSLEDEFPCASWLPVICQNPVAVPPTWKSLRRVHHQRGYRVLWASVAMSAFVVGLRSLGVFQGTELQAFDQMLRWRPNEATDNRLLVVGATESDINKYGFPLPDAILAQTIKQLEVDQAQVIGLDIYRHNPENADLIKRMQNSDRLITLCKVREGDEGDIPAPPGIPLQRQGFSDVVVDGDRIVRRHLLAMTPPPSSKCKTEYAFSLQLALKYLANQGISSPPTEVLQLKNKVFPKLQSHTGGYHQLDARGYQILLNYRFPQVSQQVSLSQILNAQIDPNTIKNRVILIGITAPSSRDKFFTPYNNQAIYQETPGVILQAQMVSQILSAVIDNRPIFWVLSPTWEILWISGWSLLGGILGWRCRSLLILGLTISVTAISLYGICYVLLLQGCWMPLVPSALVVVSTATITFFIIYKK